MIGAVTSARYARFTLSRLSLTNFPLEFPSGVVLCLDTTTALIIVNMAPPNPVENEDACCIVVLRYGHSLPVSHSLAMSLDKSLTLHVKMVDYL